MNTTVTVEERVVYHDGVDIRKQIVEKSHIAVSMYRSADVSQCRCIAVSMYRSADVSQC